MDGGKGEVMHHIIANPSGWGTLHPDCRVGAFQLRFGENEIIP